MTEDQNKHGQEILFSKYVRDNNHSLTGLGVIATIAALFLNLNAEQYSQSLVEIQTVLIILLMIASLFVAITTSKWLNDNCDGWFSSIIGGLTFLLPFNVAKFLYENFREEISSLMNLFLISVFLGLIFFWNKHINEISSFINDKMKLKGIFIFPILNTIGITIILSLIEIYMDFMKEIPFKIFSSVTEVASGPFIKIIFILSLFAEFLMYKNYLNLKRKTALFIGMSVSTVIIGYYIIKYIF